MKTINEQTNWWVRVTEENKETLDKWFKSSSHLKGKVGVYLNYQSIYCKGTISENTPAKDKDGSWDFGNEISFEEFKRYILKEYTIPENWCIKITNSNNSYLNEERFHGCTDYGFLNYHLNGGITNFWNWSADFPKGCIEITLDDFKKYVILEPIAKVYPTSLEKVKFKSEPDKCVGKQPYLAYLGDDDDLGSISNTIKRDIQLRTIASQEIVDKRALEKAISFGERYGMSEDLMKKYRITLYPENPVRGSYRSDKGSMFLYGTGGEIDNSQAEKEFKWAELPDYMLKQRTTYDVLKLYPLTPKECFKAPSDIIYVKKLKTFLK